LGSRFKLAAQRRAFTLIEVILAIGIAAGILTVVLFFYRQSETLRDRLLDETSRLSAVRLVMERLSADLSAARRCDSMEKGLTGSPDHLEFVKLEFPQISAWSNAPTVSSAAAPFHLVSYSLVPGTNSDGESGLIRSEELLSSRPTLTSTNDSSTNLDLGTPAPRAGMAAEQIQFLRFRYFNGASWLDNWSSPGLPVGIEVTLGNEPLPAESTPEDYPFELYRRVICLPNYASGATSSRAEPTAAAKQEEEQ